ncbi:glycoside hydrolase family 44 protein [Paenibacillus flagellatus]|nr:glycoside hydrolase family 44 protein [Paenibacillus flagellatus]
MKGRKKRAKPLRSVALALTGALLAAQAAFVPPAANADAGTALTVYDDALSADFVDYGWAETDLAETGIVHGGSRAIRLDPDGGKALYFYKDRIMNADEYDSLRFWIHGGTAGGQQLKLVLSLGGQGVTERQISDLLPGGVKAGQWSEVSVKLADVGAVGLLDGIWLWGDGEQEPVYLDDIAFVKGSGGTGTQQPGGQQPGGQQPGGQQPGGQQQPQLVGLSFAEPLAKVRAGDRQPTQLTASLSDGTHRDVTPEAEWSSADEAVAQVSAGLVIGRTPGTTTIKAVYGGAEALLPVEVLPYVPSQGIPIEPVDGVYVYDDALNGQFADYSWAQRSLEENGTIRSGSRSIRFEPDGDGALYLYSDRIISTKDFEKLQIWVNGGATGGQKVKLALLSGGQPAAERSLDDLIPGGIPAGGWSKVELMLADLNLPNGIFDGILFAGANGGDQAAVYLDDIALVKKYVAPPAVVEVRMNMHQLVLLPGETFRLDAEAFLETGATDVVTAKAEWQSDRPDIVQVEGGALTAHGTGIAKITAAYKTFTASAYVQVAQIAPESVYEDGLSAGYYNRSWHDKDLANTEQAHGGDRSVKFEPDGWDGVWFGSETKREIADYYGLEFWIHGGTTGGQKLKVHAYDNYTALGAIDLADYVPGGSLPAGQWSRVIVNFADMGLTDGQFDGVIFQAGTESDQAAVYIDDVYLLRNTQAGRLPQPELPAVKIGIDTSADRRVVSPDIYGINFNDMHPNDSELAFPVQRWGGNNTTRYNWELDVANRASDWFFINYPYDNDHPEQLPHGSTSDKFVDDVLADNGKVLLTVPTIGWTPKERAVHYGFSQQKYGPQQARADELRDAGNGVRPNGDLVTNNDPEDTSKRIGPDFVTRWMDHLKGRTGDRINFYALDNEPEIWHVTHRDVHPNAPTYDEIWGFTEKYGAAIKEKDPDAQIFGPTSWGWCAYFYSSADNCADGPDRQAHGGKPFLEWYLQKVKEYEQAHGVRLVDYLDVHFYPQENVVTSGEEGPIAAKRRFQSLKSLYDPNFVDESWIQEPIRLIPRMKEMIESNLPGAKLAITEYNFGNGDGITAGLAQAEALAIFGREGVDLATRFGAMKAGTTIEDAFKLYLNYDGQGSKVDGTSVRTKSSNADAVGAYTIEGRDGRLYVLLFNKDTVARQADVNANGSVGGQAQLYRFDAKSHVSAAGEATVGEDGGLSVRLPARSATLVVWNP